MARPAARHPTDLELEILKIIWRDGPQSVRYIADALAPKRKLAITSVQTIVGIMTRKGYLRRSKETGSYIYHSRVSQASTTRRIVQDVARRLFGGNVSSMILNLLDITKIDAKELAELRAQIDQKAGTKEER